jgi:hypothetical protein
LLLFWARLRHLPLFPANPTLLYPTKEIIAEGWPMNGADTAWIIVATVLVLFMTLPGLALFYGGLVRARNVLSVFMHCYAIACLIREMWFVFVYSIAFGDSTSV